MEKIDKSDIGLVGYKTLTELMTRRTEHVMK